MTSTINQHYNSQYSTYPKYRADIDGLRAIAVLSVVGFHAFPNWVKGGFIGVDIFFVISGYLISSIIFSKLEHDRFSLFDFYSRRIKRIFPALSLVLIVTYVFGWFTLLADEYKQLGKHIAGGAGFISNFILWIDSGYFDNSAESKPLLHLWSLAIEEQFYIFWPLLLAFVWKKKSSFVTITTIVAVISFLFNILLITKKPIAAFYSPGLRFWELMIGGLLAYITLHKPHLNSKHINIQSIIGFIFLVLGLVFINKDREFPGWWGLLPTLGAFFIISSGQNALLNKCVLSNKILVWFGLISFPLYLWHWPLLSLARIIESETPTYEIKVGIVLISIALAWLTYILIEKPIRFGNYGKIKTIILFGLMVTVGYIGYNTYKRGGLLDRYVVEINTKKESGFDGGFAWYNKDCDFIDDRQNSLFYCTQDTRAEPKYALIGDSKAGALSSGLFRTSSESGRWVYFGSNSNVTLVPILSNDKIYRNYQNYSRASVEVALDLIIKNQHIEYVVIGAATRALFQLKNDFSIDDLPISNNYDAALQGFNKTIEKLIEARKKIVLVVDNPTLPYPEDCIKRKTGINFVNNILLTNKNNPRCYLDINQYLELSKPYRRLLAEIKNKYSDNVTIFDGTNILCDTIRGVCPPIKNGRPMYGITDHISDYASGLIGAEINKYLSEKLTVSN